MMQKLFIKKQESIWPSNSIGSSNFPLVTENKAMSLTSCINYEHCSGRNIEEFRAFIRLCL